jgi:hypothetical protein
MLSRPCRKLPIMLLGVYKMCTRRLAGRLRVCCFYRVKDREMFLLDPFCSSLCGESRGLRLDADADSNTFRTSLIDRKSSACIRKGRFCASGETKAPTPCRVMTSPLARKRRDRFPNHGSAYANRVDQRLFCRKSRTRCQFSAFDLKC